jgi:hypothetical protein
LVGNDVVCVMTVDLEKTDEKAVALAVGESRNRGPLVES